LNFVAFEWRYESFALLRRGARFLAGGAEAAGFAFVAAAVEWLLFEL
jgi:hypothetical protein